MSKHPEWLRDDYDGPTPSLAEFMAEYERDDNVFWMLAGGHHQNLLEEAVGIIAAVRREAESWRDSPKGELAPTRGVGQVFLAILDGTPEDK